MRVSVALSVPLILAAAAASANARPRIEILEHSSGAVARDDCFPPGYRLAVAGSGFDPGARVRVGDRRVRADRRGRFETGVPARAPQSRGQQRFALRTRQLSPGPQRGRPVKARRYWSTIQGIDVPSWERGGLIKRGRPGRVQLARIGAFDFAVGRNLYVHYLLDGRQVFAQRVGRLRGPCGADEFRFVEFPFSPVPNGVYTVEFSANPDHDPDAGATGYRRVRVGAPPSPLPPSTTPMFTIAGDGTNRPAPDGAAATESGFPHYTALAARADGGLLLTEAGRVRAVDTSGRVTTVAGTGRPGSSGDGGPAVAAAVAPTAVAAAPDGGFVIAQCEEPAPPVLEGGGRLRHVSPDGTISTIAGSGRLGRLRDGAPANKANLSCSGEVVVAPDGRVLFTNDRRLLQLGADGRVRILAGSGEYPDPGSGEYGGPARRTALVPTGVDLLPDGSVLLADSAACHVYRLHGRRLTVVAGTGAEGRRRDDGERALDATICPNDVAVAPGGGFYVTDVGWSRLTGAEPRVRFVRPDGRIVTVAGSGRFSPEPSRGEELRGDGMPGPAADLQYIEDVAVLASGGVAFTEGNYEGRRLPGLVRYLPPPERPLLAVGVRRDRDRIFASGTAAFTTVSLTAPAEVTVTVRQDARVVSEQTLSLPDGDTRVTLPALAPIPHVIALSARDSSGRVAHDRAGLLPRGWLATKLARSIASGLIFTALDSASYSGDGLGRCRRFAAHRIDCAMVPDFRCRAVVTIRLGSDGRLRWGTYRCPLAGSRRLLKPLRLLRRRHLSCESSETSCPPPLFGRVADRWLVPWD